MPFISILILTYNSSRFIDELFGSLERVLGKSIDDGAIEIVVVDNDSSDNTIQVVKGHRLSRHVRLIANKTNSGYASGINLAASKAKGNFLLIINPDAQLISFNLAKALSFFEKRKKASIAGFRIVNEVGTREKNAGSFFSPLTLLFYSLGLEQFTNLRYSPSSTEVVDYVSGGFMMLKRSSFEELGGFDEDYFMYIEDMDLCFRAQKMGMQVYFLPFGELKHQGQGSSSREFAIVNIYKGLFIFYKKHKRGSISYLRFLLRFKAALIIFIGSVLRNYRLVASYRKAASKLA